MPDAFEQFVRLFNAGEYRACVDPLEALWFRERDDFHKGLIRLCVALHQLQLGLITSPRFLLETAAELLRPYAPRHRGVDVAELLAGLQRCRAIIPAGLETGGGHVPAEDIPALRIAPASDVVSPPGDRTEQGETQE